MIFIIVFLLFSIQIVNRSFTIVIVGLPGSKNICMYWLVIYFCFAFHSVPFVWFHWWFQWLCLDRYADSHLYGPLWCSCESVGSTPLKKQNKILLLLAVVGLVWSIFLFGHSSTGSGSVRLCSRRLFDYMFFRLSGQNSTCTCLYVFVLRFRLVLATVNYLLLLFSYREVSFDSEKHTKQPQ